MSKIITSGCVDYKKTVTWTLSTHNLKEFLVDDAIEIHSPPTKRRTSSEYDFQFKMNLEHDYLCPEKLIYIYYKSPKQIVLKSVKLHIVYDGSEKKESGYDYMRAKLGANKWKLLYKTSSILQRVRLETTRVMCLNFEFIVYEKQFQIPTPQLSNSMKNLLSESLFSDVVIKSADGEEFKCHKAVLANRCVVLKAHFEHNTTECITNIVESHLESEVLREVLFFIYTDKAPKVDEIPGKLLAAADYYQLSRLKSLCEEALHKKLTVNNAIATLQLADLHSANTLEKLALLFIKGRQSRITRTEGWANLKSVELLKKIFE